MTKIKGLVLGLVLACACAASGVAAEHDHSATDKPETASDTLSMTKFYIGVQGHMGPFPGKLVCLRCDLAKGQMVQCAKEGHRHALSMDDGSMIHPLIAGSKELTDRINSVELHGKEVTVSGIYYPNTGIIFVSGVEVQQ